MIQDFIKAAAHHACTDSVDSWNDMVEAWNALTNDEKLAIESGLVAAPGRDTWEEK